MQYKIERTIVKILWIIYFCGLLGALFTGAKTVIFLLLVEITLPFYLYILFRQQNYKKLLNNPVLILFGLFILAGTISAVLGINFNRSFWGDLIRLQGIFLWIHLLLFSFYLYLAASLDKKNLTWILKLVVYMAAIVSIHGILQQMGIDRPEIDPFASRASSIFGNPIYFASFLILLLFLSLYFSILSLGKSKWLYIGSFILIFAGILSTKTAGANVAMFGAFGIGASIYLILSPNLKLKYGSIPVLLLLIFVILLKPSMITNFTDEMIMETDARSRLLQWSVAIDGIKEAPVFGVGPENYSYISNKYFNPDIYKYLFDYFDKPHNYFLEVLLTQGFVGFSLYILFLSSVYYALYKAFRGGLLNLSGFAILVSAFSAYLIQNLFVFETISASIVFAIFVSFAAFIHKNPVYEPKTVKSNNHLIPWVPGLAIVLVVILLFAYHIPSITASNYLARGISLSKSQPEKAKEYFDKTLDFPDFIDKIFIGQKYQELAVQTATTRNSEYVVQILSSAAEYNKKALQRNPYSIENWLDLAQAYMGMAQLNKVEVDPYFFEAIKKAKELAPNRLETALYEIDYYNSREEYDKAGEIARSGIIESPEFYQLLWKQVFIYAYQGKDEAAMRFLAYALSETKNRDETAERIRGLLEYYVKKDFNQIISIYLKAIEYDPYRSEYYFSLASAYEATGQKQKAIEMALKGLEFDPSQKQEVEEFIKNLN